MIEEAIKAEQEYINKRVNQVETAPLVDILKAYGYNSLNEYFNQKKEYILKNCNMEERYCGVDEVVPILGEIIETKQPTLLILKPDSFFVYHGDEKYNEQVVKEMNIPVYEIGHCGGTIIGSAGDLSICIAFPNGSEMNTEIVLNKFKEILNKYSIIAEVDNNDLLIDGKKVLGSASIGKDFYFFVCHISFSDKTDLIEQICGVAAKKPGFISGINRDDFVNEVKLWLL